MSQTNTQLTELRQYMEDFEVGLATRLDGLADRLQTMEGDLAIIKASVVTSERAEPGPTEPLQADERKE